MAEKKHLSETKYLYLGIDVGGTSVKEGLFTAKGELLSKVSVPTPPLVDEVGYGAVTGGIRELLKDAHVEVEALRGIGLAVPCPVPADGDIKVQANIKLDFPGLTSALKTAFPQASVRYENDANAAALGELWQGAAAGKRSLVFITLGTGVGGGIVVDGKIVSGANGSAGEIGHMCLNPDEQRTCGCGGKGHLEQYSSASGLVSSYRLECAKRGVEPAELSGPSDSITVFDLCRGGDECALAAMGTMVDYLARAMSIISAVVDPEEFVLGGGTSGAADVFLQPLKEAYQGYALKSCIDTPIVVASLGNDAGIIGAAYVALSAAFESLSSAKEE